MPKFHVSEAFAIESRQLFVLSGSIVEGEIRPGMFVHIPFNSSFGMTARIAGVEFALRAHGQEATCLCIRYEKSLDLDLWQGLRIADEILEVTKEGEE